ncbi:pentatricopeptide repeat-containing protein At3g04750, mitochondrial [Typha latifolia]|uniref:pentatricopeptide repeat-containing protein At3g04750, mitochondrial n=1 Tax=Typha latifolia TaxID=4733 RepID=UPI003C2E47E8
MIKFGGNNFPRSLLLCTHYGFRLCSPVASAALSKSSWDPTVSLRLEHPVLVLLEKCTSGDNFKQILAQTIRLHLITETFPMSRLLYFSTVSHPEYLNEALLLFKHFTPRPNLYIYNIMVSAVSFSPSQSVSFYRSMISSHIYPDEHTLLSLLKSSNHTSVGKQIHVHVVINGFNSHVYLQNSLIKMYFETGDTILAQMMFDYMSKRDIVSYNIMLSGYARKGYSSEALKLFYDMEASGIEPDQYTIVALLMSCGQMKNVHLGKSIHGFIIRKMPLSDWNLILNNALLDMYAKCEDMISAMKTFHGFHGKDNVSWNTIVAGFANIGELDTASSFFREAPYRDLISWNSLLAGYAKKDFMTMMKLFMDMLSNDIRSDKVTAIILISAAADMGILNYGKSIHGWVLKTYGIIGAFLGSALIDMYCKCGKFEWSCIVFEKVLNKDVAVWTAAITGLAFHGHGTKAVELFWKMQEEGLVPNSVTLVAVLTACSHAGLVDQGYRVFEDMKTNYNVEPRIEHYGCMVDLLARSGRLTEAIALIERMPIKPSQSIWGAILSASKAYSNTDLAEAASRELLKLEPEEESGYILLSNVYAACGQWSYSDKIRELMENKGVKKIAGCSIMVVDGVLHEFLSSDKRHPRWDEVSCISCDLHKLMRIEAENMFQIFQDLQVPDVH